MEERRRAEEEVADEIVVVVPIGGGGAENEDMDAALGSDEATREFSVSKGAVPAGCKRQPPEARSATSARNSDTGPSGEEVGEG